MRAAKIQLAAVVPALLALLVSPAAAQLRIVTYNTNTFGTEAPGSAVRAVRPEADIVFQAIGEELVNGIQRPADIILLQEQQQVGSTTQDLLERLNAIYADQGITYARGQLEPGITADPGSGLGVGPGALDENEIRQGFLYRTDSVTVEAEGFFGNISGTNQPRATQFIQFRPVGFGPGADLFVFNSHFEAGDDTGFGGDLFARENEATDIRNFIAANNLGSSNVIVAGDLNVDSNFETSGVTAFGGRSALQILSDGTDAGGRVLDPLFRPDPFTGVVPDVDFQIFSPGVPNTQAGVNLGPFLTQSPCEFSCDTGLTPGGIDDRFDFLLQSDELLDGEGVASIPGTLRSFGNNGSTGNDAINDGNTIQIQGLTSFTTAQVLDALESASDHLPVVQDFQLPALLSGSLAGFDSEAEQGAAAFLTLNIANASPVDVPIGADELDFEVLVTGDTLFSATGTDLADAIAAQVVIPLDTSVVGERSLQATITTSSPGVPNDTLLLNLSYTVLAPPLAGDLNGDGRVDAADFVTLRAGVAEGVLGFDSFQAFLANFGAEAPAAPSLAQPVPEPAAASLLAAGVLSGALLRRRRSRRRRGRINRRRIKR